LFLLIFESIGAPELLVIVVVALIIFGPRKLPQLSRSLGKSLSEFKRQSDEFQRTWEREVALEETDKDARISQHAALPEDNSILGTGQERSLAVLEAGDGNDQAIPQPRGSLSESPVEAALPLDSSPEPATTTTAAKEAAPASEPTRKRDWL
jgi:TatA/E family protein of Tat protein translocase